MSDLYRLRGLERVVPNFAPRRNVSVLRYPKGGYSPQGRPKGQTPEMITIRALVQTATDEELQKVEEGRRTKGGIKIYTDLELRPRTASVELQVQPDEVLWDGRKWQVEKVDNWSEHGFHYKAIAIKMGQ